MRTPFVRTAALAAVVVCGALGAHRAVAQNQPVRQWEPRGFDFTPDGVWRRKAAAVRASRMAALARGDLLSLNAPMTRRAAGLMATPGPNSCQIANVVCGILYEPVFLVDFKNTVAAPYQPSEYFDALLAAAPTQGRPFTIRTFYEQMSNGLLSIQGQVIGWTTLDSNDTFYEGGTSNCNALCGSSQIKALMVEAVAKNDAAVNFGQFDNDGPDGIPNSGDDDGFVDLAVFVQPERDGACGGNSNIWSHRFAYSGWTGTTIVTQDTAWANPQHTVMKGFIQVNNYTIQSGLGGTTSCDINAIMAIGTVAHETGHGFGLPDFYDTFAGDADNSEGIGHWGLMSSGNYAKPPSPAHMEGFSRFTLGWVTLVDIPPGSYTLGPYTVGDTIFRITPPVIASANPRLEYYLLENRQATLGDTALISSFSSGQTPKQKGPGLLIWHVDPVQYSSALGINRVNSGLIHALKLEQADNLDELGSSNAAVRNRGDAGDPFPGTSGNTAFGPGTLPPANLNTGTFSGVFIDSIRQTIPGGEMAFRLRFGGVVNFTSTGSGSIAASGGITTGSFRPVTDSVILTATPSGANVIFAGWTGDTITSLATLKLKYNRSWNVAASFQSQLLVADTVLHAPVMGVAYLDTVTMSGGTGQYAYQVLSGAFPPGITVGVDGVIGGIPSKDGIYTFTVRASSGSQIVDLSLRLSVSIPTLAVNAVVAQLLAPGSASGLTADQLRFLDLLGNNNNAFDVGDFMAWLDKTGNVVSAETMRRVMARSVR